MSGLTLVKSSEYLAAGSGETLAALGVGSCVIVALYDAENRVGGFAHPLLPEPPNGKRMANPGRYGATVVPLLLERMRERGADPGNIFARLAGGAAMFGPLLSEEGRSLGTRNADALRAALGRSGVPIRAEEVGGERGRSVFLSTDDGALRVRSIGQDDVLL